MKKEPFLFSFAVGFHDFVSEAGRFFYMNLFPPKINATPENAREKMEEFAQSVQEKPSWKFIFNYGSELDDLKEQFVGQGLEEKLSSLGLFYITRKELDDKPMLMLWNAAKQYDFKGIIPAPNEKLRDFVYRANTLLFIHKHLRGNGFEPEIEFDKKTREIQLKLLNLTKFIRREDLEEANKRIPYYMDLTWVAAYVKSPKEMMVPALGLTFTLPQYNGLNFIQMRSSYKTREQFMNVLSHEMVHAGTVYLDTRRDYLETKAYSVGKGSLLLGEYVVALNSAPALWMRAIKFVSENFFYIPFPNNWFRFLPKIRSAVEIMDNAKTYRIVEQELRGLYGKKGGYVLGRLNGDEIEEFRDTNNIPARIRLKKDLKWRILRTNFEKT